MALFVKNCKLLISMGSGTVQTNTKYIKAGTYLPYILIAMLLINMYVFEHGS